MNSLIKYCKYLVEMETENVYKDKRRNTNQFVLYRPKTLFSQELVILFLQNCSICYMIK